MEPLPHFKYHPDPFATGMIQQKPTTCPVCEQVRAYVYVGPFLAKEEVEGICPWCIHDGSAAAKYQGTFQDPASCEEAAPEYWEELLFRTPGYRGWEQQVWLSHHHDFCAFVGYAEWKEIEPVLEEFAEDLESTGDSYPELYRWGSSGSFQGYLFQCVVCGKRRLATDAKF